LRVRITATPIEKEVDGVSLEGMRPGVVREVSSIVGAWLIAQGYAAAEMRHAPNDDDDRGFHPQQDARQASAQDRRHRKS
jgi:hypothetical protein